MFPIHSLVKLAAICTAALLFKAEPATAPPHRELPSGWRLPTNLELNEEWRHKDPDRYSIVSSDFNGDGLADEAMLLVSLQKKRFGLFVFVSQANARPKVHCIYVTNDVTLLPAMGITKVPPGKYRTACGKGYWKCKKGEVPEILIAHDAIEFFKTESASSYFYWNERSDAFRKIWIND
jgi:hypothetical protein